MFALINRIIDEKDERVILKRSAFFNLIASILNSTLSTILLFFITRLSGLNVAGMFSIAFAISYQCLSLGNFGSRNFQASDVKHVYSFGDYIYIRIFSAVLMYSMLIYYSFMSGYSNEKAMVVFSFGLFKSIDAIEDIVHGEYHRNNRLDIASLLLIIRYAIAISLFIIVYALTRDFIFTSFLSLFVTIVIFIVENKTIISRFYHDKIRFNFANFKSLLVILTPICISNYIRMYVTNLPKYVIDDSLNEIAQSYFSILIMPVFIINLLSDVIFRPFITRLSTFWNDDNIHDFVKMLFIQLGIIVLLTLIMMAGGYIIGLKLLGLVFGVDLSSHMASLMILLLAGGFNTASSFLNLVLIIQGQQTKFTAVYIITTIIAIAIATPLIMRFEIIGASLLYLLICFTFFACFAVFVYRSIKNKNG